MIKRRNATQRLVCLAIAAVLLVAGLFSVTGYAEEPAAPSAETNDLNTETTEDLEAIPENELEPEQGNTVTTTVTLNGDPVESARVRLAGLNADPLTYATTNSSGVATFENVANGNYSFTVYAEVGSYAAYHSERFAVPGPVPDIELEAGHSVTACVTLNGATVGGVKVKLAAGLTSIINSTGSDGTVTFNNVPTADECYFNVSRSASGAYASYCGKTLGETFSISSDSCAEIELSAGESITTKVTLKGAPEAGARVTLVQVEPADYEDDDQNNVTYGPVTTDESGMASFDKIGSGVYYFEATDASGNYSYDYEYSEGVFTIPSTGSIPNIELDLVYTPAPPVNPANPGKPDSKPNNNGSGSHSNSGRGSYSSNGGGFSGGSSITAPSAAKWMSDSQPEKASSFTGQYGVRAAAWKKLAGAAYYHSTMNEGAVQVRLYIDEPGKLTRDAHVSAYVKGTGVESVENAFNAYFKNKIRAIHFDQQDDWEQPVRVAALVNLEGIKTDNLYFYQYDSKTGTYKPLALSEYHVDANGYLCFTTPCAKDLVISEGALEKR